MNKMRRYNMSLFDLSQTNTTSHTHIVFYNYKGNFVKIVRFRLCVVKFLSIADKFCLPKLNFKFSEILVMFATFLSLVSGGLAASRVMR